jgi:tetraacyldisaccharide 4'-kinase
MAPHPRPSCPVFPARIVPEAVVRVLGAEWVPEPLDVLAGRAVVAACGIARPERFLADLGRLGARVTRSVLRPDHHPWNPAEVEALVAEAAGDLVVTTEKDLVKWILPPSAPVRALRIGVEIEDGAALVRLAGGAGVVCE